MNNLYKFILTLFLTLPVLIFGQFHIKETSTGNGSGANWDNAMSYVNMVNQVNSTTNRNSNILIKLYQGNYLATNAIDFRGFFKVEITGGYIYEIDPETGGWLERSGDETTSVVDGQNTTKLFKFENNLEVTLKNFTSRNANPTSPTEKGSLISFINSPNLKLKFEHIVFNNNNLSNTSAVYIDNIQSFETDFTQFNNNRATNNSPNNGSALFIINTRTVKINNTTFKDNYSSSKGAALYLKDLDDVKMEQFFGNNTNTEYVYNFENNVSLENGGAIYNDNSNLSLTAIYFKNNESRKNGGAIYSTVNSKNELSRIHFEENKAQIGGAIYNESNNDYRIQSSLFNRNVATNYAGGIYNKKQLLITNATFVNNSNSAIVYATNSRNTIYNSIFYLNQGNAGSLKKDLSSEIQNDQSATNDIQYNIVEEYSTANHNIIADPLFVDNNNNFTLKITNNNSMMQVLSPAFNAGKEELFSNITGNATTGSFDLDKRNRNYGNSLDLGAYELTFDSNFLFPVCPFIVTPYDNEENVALRPNISWNNINNANQYQLIVQEQGSADPTINLPVLATTINNTNFNNYTTDLKPNTFYNVKIHPENTLIGVKLETCPVFKFKTMDIPTIPSCTTAIIPVNGEQGVSLTPTIKWNKISNATSYQLIIGTSQDGNDILDRNVGNVDSFTLSTLTHNTTYFVKIIAINAVGPAVSCASTTFTTLLPPDPCVQVKVSVNVSKKDVTVNVVNGQKPYEYRINEGVWQTTNLFPDVAIGRHTIEIKTAEGCQKSVIFEIPSFYNLISPNNDGKNDELDFSFLKFKQNASVLIVDRFGKTVFKDNGENNFIWKGKQANGMALPTNTYWYFLEWNEQNSETKNRLQGWVLLKNK